MEVGISEDFYKAETRKLSNSADCLSSITSLLEMLFISSTNLRFLITPIYIRQSKKFCFGFGFAFAFYTHPVFHSKKFITLED